MKLILASDLSFLLKYGYDLTGIEKSDIKIKDMVLIELIYPFFAGTVMVVLYGGK